jgi:hypothetical protein
VGANLMNNEEKALRSHIRKAIKIVKEKREDKALQEEQKLRNIIRNLISEAKKVPKWDSYGKNNLDIMLMKTNFLDALETGYKALTTTEAQRESYEIHILQNIKRTLNLEIAKDVEGDQSRLNEEEVSVTVDDGGLMGLNPEQEKQQEVDKEFEEFRVEGEDYSGLREAYEAFRLIEDTLLNYWKKMDLEEDRQVFYDNLIEQMNLYFDKWESELDLTPEEPIEIKEPELDLAPEEPAIDLEMPEEEEEEEEI